MEDSKVFKYSTEVVLVPLILIFIIWFVYWVEITFGYNFNRYGILPNKVSGLKGIIFSPFIHGSTSHLFNNSVPLFVLLACLLFFYRQVAIQVLVFGTVITGLLTWIVARDSYHIGASGVVYLLFSFIFFSGILRKHYRLVALSLVVVFLYGGLIWYVFPIKKGMSWEGHLAGFLAGLVLTFIYRKVGPQKKVYEFKKTAFDLMFDEDGNYNPPSEEQEQLDD